MDEIELKERLISACAKYINYLRSTESVPFKKQKKGKTVSVVHSFSRVPGTSGEFICLLKSKVDYIDASEVFVKNCPAKHIRIIEYTSEKHAMPRVRLSVFDEHNPGLPEAFARLSPGDITIESSLLFLYERLYHFYQESQIFIRHDMPLPLPPHSFPVSVTPTAEQQRAIDGIFSAPLSYVWGPPGTGKTRIVLAECLLRYLQAGKCVFLLAPTNNSVEQMLRGILPVLRDAGIDLHCVYRLGTATAEFSREYPEVIGSSADESLLSDRKSRRDLLLQQRDSILAHVSEASQMQSRLEALQGLRPLLYDYYAITEQCADSREKLDLLDSNITANVKQQSAVLEEKATLSWERSQTDSHISALRAESEKLRWKFWKKAAYQESLNALSILDTERHKLSERIQQLEDEYTALCTRKKALLADRNAETDHLSFLIHQKDDLFPVNDLPPAAVDFLRTLESLDESSALSSYEALLAAEQAVLSDFEAAAPGDLQKTLEELQVLDAKLADPDSAKLTQLKNARILAGTVFSAMLHLPSDRPVAHIFLDEAGYTSLALGLVSLCCTCPITFLGDHLQLPPICEMKKIPAQNMEVSLFSLPCVRLSELCTYSMSDFHQSFFEPSTGSQLAEVDPPTFEQVQLEQLTFSHRFDNRLAAFLSTHIYPFRFSGLPSSGFIVEAIDAPTGVQKFSNNESDPEMRAILWYVQAHADALGNFSILTPYRNQRDLLQENLPAFRDCISTVHAAQGMEFDTVILSVVDKEHLFSCDSTTPHGRSVLNTAISRTKSRLVIACDVAFWSQQRGQLIADLLTLADVVHSSSAPPAPLPAAPAPAADSPAHGACPADVPAPPLR